VKLKVVPQDFLVEEVSEIASGKGPYAVYRLVKSSWDTFDLLVVLARRMGVPRDAVSVGGMKDRHGTTTQLVSVRASGRLPRSINEKNFSMELIGRAEEPMSARAVAGNRFSLVLRDMTDAEVRAVEMNLGSVREIGFPNYYDEQRFGSARHGGGFMGKSLFLGRREEALKLYFLASKHDDQKTRKLKKMVTENWGRWNECLGSAFGEYRRILEYLSGHSRAYHMALGLMDRRFLVFALNAYQSYLFNEVLRRWIKSMADNDGFPVRALRYAFGEYLFPLALPEGLGSRMRSASLPIPGFDTVTEDPAVRAVLDDVLNAENIRLSDLRVRQMRKLSAHGILRQAFVRADGLSEPGVAADELYPGRKKVSLSFFLPRGSYATILVKRICLPPAAR
jgi:tRNA pseudouridine13 synthase